MKRFRAQFGSRLLLILFLLVLGWASCGPQSIVKPEKVQPEKDQSEFEQVSTAEVSSMEKSSEKGMASGQESPDSSEAIDTSVQSLSTDDDEAVLCSEVGIPVFLVRQNIETTDFSGAVRIESSQRVGPNDGPPSDTGYVNHKYEASVLEIWRGKFASKITFYEMADADAKTREPGKVLIVSLCHNKNTNRYHSPDNGYVFGAPKACLAKGKQISKSAAVSNHSACSQ